MGNDRSSEIYHALLLPPKIELERISPEKFLTSRSDQPIRVRRRRAGLVEYPSDTGVGRWRDICLARPAFSIVAGGVVTSYPQRSIADTETDDSHCDSGDVIGCRASGCSGSASRWTSVWRIATCGISAGIHASLLGAHRKKRLAHSMFAKADSQEAQDGWVNIVKLPCVLTICRPDPQRSPFVFQDLT